MDEKDDGRRVSPWVDDRGGIDRTEKVVLVSWKKKKSGVELLSIESIASEG